jgi:hypothetical protein
MPPGEFWTTRYEDLRRTAVRGTGFADGSWGLALFMRRGLAAWMDAWPSPTGNTTAPGSTPPPGSASPVAVPSPLSGPLVTILASMVFAARREACA